MVGPVVYHRPAERWPTIKVGPTEIAATAHPLSDCLFVVAQEGRDFDLIHVDGLDLLHVAHAKNALTLARARTESRREHGDANFVAHAFVDRRSEDDLGFRIDRLADR